jgi:hypothetical protein
MLDYHLGFMVGLADEGPLALPSESTTPLPFFFAHITAWSSTFLKPRFDRHLTLVQVQGVCTVWPDTSSSISKCQLSSVKPLCNNTNEIESHGEYANIAVQGEAQVAV